MLRPGRILAAGLIAVTAAITLHAQQQQQQRPRRVGQAPRDARPDRRAAEPGTGAISGVVQVAGTGQPARRARVTLAGPQLGGNRASVTDDQGRFAFTELPAGRMTLSANKPGHVAIVYGQKRAGAPGTPIELADGQKLSIQLQIPRGGVLTGTILDEHGEATPGTNVRAMRFVVQNGQPTLQQAGGDQTDDRGSYRIYGLQPGNYLICANPRPLVAQMLETLGPQIRSLAESIATSGAVAGEARAALEQGLGRGGGAGDDEETSTGYAPVCYPGATTASDAAPVTLGVAEERSGVDFRLQLTPLATVEGVVIGSGGDATLNAQVVLVRPRDQVAGLFNRITARAGTDGRFRLERVPPGQYTVMARTTPGGGRGNRLIEAVVGQALGARGQRGAAGARGAGRGNAEAPDPQAPLIHWATADIAVDGRNVTNVTLALQPAMTLTGQLTFEGANAASAEPTRLRVNLVPLDPATGSGATGRVDAAGRFTVPNILPGDYRLNVVGGAPWTEESATIAGQDALDFPVQIRPSQASLTASITMTDQHTEVRGQAMDGSGTPATGVTLIIYPSDRRYWVPNARRIQTARPATTGTFIFRNLPPGDYRMAHVADLEPGSQTDPAVLQELDGLSTRVTLQPGEKKVQNITIR